MGENTQAPAQGESMATVKEILDRLMQMQEQGKSFHIMSTMTDASKPRNRQIGAPGTPQVPLAFVLANALQGYETHERMNKAAEILTSLNQTLQQVVQLVQDLDARVSKLEGDK